MIDQARLLRLLGLIWLTLAAAALPASARLSILAMPPDEPPAESPAKPQSPPVDTDSHHARIAVAPSLDVWDGQAARSLTIQILVARPALPAAGPWMARCRFETVVLTHNPANADLLRPVGIRRLRLTGCFSLAPPADR